ncbi:MULTISPECIES: COX15/CtaA family protein [Gordonia]|uniref:COX15/CtaA family protein n=2 Tax=Gordonia TaxID=2053 RepID=A0ABP5UKF4_9ACTN|nr:MULTISPECIES: COX15/CtaA family protein [Gordonia]AUH69070.1 heme A synthase [Gordonia sp. YC-JH1]KJR06596.1 cytochrome oxidase assembly protein [Gordonia sihwensis]KXT56847.1 cytochrome oxidase assembly protein [Gordonia sp. QH-12]MBY4568619.1 heme A synthase [Gordonia sihwensis]GAC59607.1 putative cytochrome oxidase assembly protein [Gordonia sihwensis NBRC 108236]
MIDSWFGFKRPTATYLYYWAIANLAANVLLVVTGGAVRVTDSGLGCPTWPQCTSGSVTPHAAMGIHGLIEFGNRMLTWVLVVIAIATWVAAMRRVPVDRLSRRLATGVAMGVPLQAIIGGITVLTNLNPWIVAFHFLATMVIISLATWMVVHTGSAARGPDAGEPGATDAESAVLRRFGVLLAWALYALTWVTIYLGTVVTGSGPHAGDIKAHRNGLEPTQATQLHVDAVWTLVGLTAALILLAVAAVPSLRRAALIFGGVIVVQGIIGYVQYAAGLPEVLVILHMFGSALLMIGATQLVLATTRR